MIIMPIMPFQIKMPFIFRRFFKDMPQVALDKKSNFELLERESGLKRFLPKSVIDSMRVSLLIAYWEIFSSI